LFESEHKLRHLPFFEEIASHGEGTAEWRAGMAGVVVLRLVDAWIEDGPRVVAADDWGIRSVRNAIDELQSNMKLRAVLASIVEILESSTIVDMGVLAPRLMAFGQLLEYDAKWTLAADVYTSIVAHTHPTQEADVATQAHLRRGFCLRHMGDLPASLAAYQTAGEIARVANDMVGVLRARIGEAKGAMARGNLPQARTILDETISEAKAHVSLTFMPWRCTTGLPFPRSAASMSSRSSSHTTRSRSLSQRGSATVFSVTLPRPF